MVILTMDFYIPRLVGKLLLHEKNGEMNVQRAEAFFSDETVQGIVDFPGLKWKVWSVSADGTHGSGVYLFDNMEDALVRKRFAEKYYWREGLLFVKCRLYEVLENPTHATRGPIDIPANPSATPEQIRQLFSYRPASPVRLLTRAVKRLKK